jgi:GNAT superfamily N-acetyltransferase
VISVRPGLAAVVKEAISGARILDDATCCALERAVTPLGAVESWFRGVRLYCEPSSFVDCSMAGVTELQPYDGESVALLHSRWGGKVFGHLVDGRAASWAAVKPLSDIVWDLSIDTLPEYRRCGYAKSAVSAALKHTFANGRLAGWGCDRENAASLCVSAAVGFRHYGYDVGCVAG